MVILLLYKQLIWLLMLRYLFILLKLEWLFKKLYKIGLYKCKENHPTFLLCGPHRWNCERTCSHLAETHSNLGLNESTGYASDLLVWLSPPLGACSRECDLLVYPRVSLLPALLFSPGPGSNEIMKFRGTLFSENSNHIFKFYK